MIINKVLVSKMSGRYDLGRKQENKEEIVSGYRTQIFVAILFRQNFH